MQVAAHLLILLNVFFLTACSSCVHSGPLGFAGTLQCVDDNLMMLGVDYIDLLMVHWPRRIKPECMLGRGDELCSDAVQTHNFPSRDMVDPGFQSRRDTWKALQLALRLHKVRSIGVSNFNQAQLQDLMHNVSAKPAVLQMFWNPLIHD